MDSIKGTTLHRLIQSALPQAMPTLEVQAQMPRDLVDLDLGQVAVAPAAAPQVAAPQAQAQAPTFVPFPGPAAQAPAASAEEPLLSAGMNNNPTVLTMDEPVAMPPQPLVDTSKPPLEQARQLNDVILQQITSFSERASMASSGEVADQLGVLSWAADHLESLSQRLEGEGKAKSDENQFIEHVQSDLAQAMQSFQQMLNGAVNTENGAVRYAAATRNEINTEMAQYNAQSSMTRQNIFAQYHRMTTGFPGAPGMPGAMPYGAPGMPGAMPYGPYGNPTGVGAYPSNTYGMGPAPMGVNGAPLGPTGVPLGTYTNTAAYTTGVGGAATAPSSPYPYGAPPYYR